MKKRMFGLFLVVLALKPANLPAQTNHLVWSLNAGVYGNPLGGLICSGNTLYGVSHNDSRSAVFKVNTDGSGFTSLVTTAGLLMSPQAGLLLSGNILYGVTGSTVFKVNTDGSDFTSILSFINGSRDGTDLRAGLILDNSTLYGTAYGGGSLTNGTVFKLQTDGTGYVIIKSFTNSPDGANPYASLVLDNNTLYGTTYRGGSSGNGTVFKLHTDGTGYTILHNFNNFPDGANPQAELVLSAGILYGTTANGGFGGGTVFRLNTNGTGYGVITYFSKSLDGISPQAGLKLNGNTLYGTTYYGGSSNKGTVFMINSDGTGYAILKNFLGLGDGAYPNSSLAMGSNAFYGTTYSDGINDGGSVFSQTTAAPQLQITSASNLPVVFWQNDGFSRTLQTTTNPNSGIWTTVSKTVPLIGAQVTNLSNQPAAYFRLQ